MTTSAVAASLVIVAVGIGTFLLRLSFIGLGERLRLPEPVVRALRFVPAAVLAAIIVPAAFRTDAGDVVLSLTNPRVLATLGAALVAWRTHSSVATLAAGMILLWLLQAM